MRKMTRVFHAYTHVFGKISEKSRMSRKTNPVPSFKPKKKTAKKTTQVVTIARRHYVPRYIPQRGPEMKYIDSTNFNGTGASFTVPNGGVFDSFHYMSPSAQGVGISAHVGNKLRWKRLVFRYTYYPGTITTAISPNTQCRILILYDTHTIGALPVLQDVFPPVAPSFDDNTNPDRIPERFIVIADHYSKQSPGEADTADRMCPVSGHISKNVDLQTIFRGSTSSISDVDEGSFIVTWANNAPGQAGSIVASWQIHFTDV